MAENTIPQSETEQAVHGWIMEALEESEGFLKAQPGYSKITESMEAIFGGAAEYRMPTLSSTESNRFGKVASDLAAELTDVKPFWEYRTHNKRYENIAVITGKLASQWYPDRSIDLRLNEAIKYYLVAGTGYTHLTWDPEIQDLNVVAEDPRDVLPIRPRSFTSIQDALGVIIRKERSVNYLRSRYPGKEHLIRVDREGPLHNAGSNTRFGQLLEKMGVPGESPWMTALFGKRPQKEFPKLPVSDEYIVYLTDESRNEKSYPVMIGDFDEDGRALNNWSYIVPPKARLYPRGRCIIASSRGILWDGPNPHWHGLYPVPKLTLDPWPWAWFGKAPLWDILKLQKSLNKNLRVVDDHMEKIARPDIIADKNSVSKAVLERYDTRQSGGKFMHNPMAGKGMQLVPPGQLPREVQWYIEFLINEIETLPGVRDLAALTKLKQLPGADTIEKITETMSASVRGRSRALETFMREFALMTAYNFAQFYTAKRRLTILGPDGVTREDFDYDPGSFVPDYLHAKDFDERGVITAAAMERGPLPRYDRAREFMRQFTFHVAPGSLLAASEIQDKLMYLQLARAGLVDHWSLLEKLGIPNVGEPPNGANSITDRLRVEQEMGLGMAISATGRKATGQTMPRMTVKES